MADDGVREWGENEFYQFHGDITKGKHLRRTHEAMPRTDAADGASTQQIFVNGTRFFLTRAPLGSSGPKRQAIAIIDGLGLHGEHHFLGTGKTRGQLTSRQPACLCCPVLT